MLKRRPYVSLGEADAFHDPMRSLNAAVFQLCCYLRYRDALLPGEAAALNRYLDWLRERIEIEQIGAQPVREQEGRQ